MILLVSLLFAEALSWHSQEEERVVKAEIVVSADLDAAWDAWTTEAGVKTFFAPAGKIELCVGGAYEMYFNPSGAEGTRGGEGNTILAIQPQRMLALTWNAPPHFPNVREQRTSVVLRFKEIAPGKTRVTLIESGWGEGDEWDHAFAYFTRAWQEIVLPRLQYRFAHGPLDWNNPPALKHRDATK